MHSTILAFLKKIKSTSPPPPGGSELENVGIGMDIYICPYLRGGWGGRERLEVFNWRSVRNMLLKQAFHISAVLNIYIYTYSNTTVTGKASNGTFIYVHIWEGEGGWGGRERLGVFQFEDMLETCYWSNQVFHISAVLNIDKLIIILR